ncbi:hypothetical protein HDU80_002656 [Chytriomyces hyalinus]|nr:hypothetical protein HDU80_002656 [Chytriomyces hyalinus]
MSKQTTPTQQLAAQTAAPAKKANFWLHFAAGGIGGTVGAVATCPLEVVKTRMQSSLYIRDIVTPVASLSHKPAPIRMLLQPLQSLYLNIASVGTALSTIRRQEGILALWKGLGPNLVGVVPARAIYFSAYNHGKQLYTSLNKGKETSIVHVASAATAGIATALCTNPIWLVKTRMQLQSEQKVRLGEGGVYYKNSLHCAQQVLKTEGIRGLYKGLSASFLGLSESTLQFVLYEHFKRSVLEHRNDQARLSASSRDTVSTDSKSLDWMDTFGVAAGAKLVAAAATYPHEVLRTRLRQDAGTNSRYKGLAQSAVLIYREEGLPGLYGGMTAHMLRVVPNACILFGTVEFILAFA